MAALQAVAAFALLLSLSSAATLTCNNLNTPLDLGSYSALTGKWVLLAMAATENMQAQLESFKSSWFEISTDDQGKLKTVHWADKINNNCVSGTGDITYSGNVINMSYQSNTYKGVYLQTCLDCLLYASQSEEGNISSYMFLAKREGSVLQESEIETFRKQAECVSFSQITFYQGGADLCPDERGQ